MFYIVMEGKLIHDTIIEEETKFKIPINMKSWEI